MEKNNPEKKISLNYKASNIAKAEDAYKKNFLECIGRLGGNGMPGFADMRFLVLAGGGSDDDFDALFASGIENLLGAVLEGINNAGFLGSETLDTEALKTQLHEMMDQVSKTAKTSQTSGEKANQ